MTKTPLDHMREGLLVLRAQMEPLGFVARIVGSGPSCGGPWAEGELANGSRRIELHFRHGVGLVRYHAGKLNASHTAYLAALSQTERARFPGFPETPLAAFENLAHDFGLIQDDFLSPAQPGLHRAAAAEEAEQDQQRRAQMVSSVGDFRVRAAAREAFRSRRYAECVRLLESAHYVSDFSPAEQRLLELARQRALDTGLQHARPAATRFLSRLWWRDRFKKLWEPPRGE